ncbi:MAG: penicillin-binding protein 2 [Actinomycetia bacterium]|nr:penicillin-binding protein 2 [Actinomycetes bacterium]MCP4962620.1 penicillin-binding protein 2 [Actinomycetes bacterium]
MLVVLVLAVVVVGWRLVHIQVLDRETYTQWGTPQRLTEVELDANRGAILDRGLQTLAVSDERPTIWLDPKLVVDPAATANALATVTGIDERSILDKIERGGRFAYIVRQTDPEIGEAVLALGLAGVVVDSEAARLLPNGDYFARGMLGRLDVDHVALTGLELQYDDLLRGQTGWESYERGRDGTLLPTGEHSLQAATQGKDLVLTVHRETQFLAEQILVEQVENTAAKGGVAIVLRSGTGEVLASAAVSADPESGRARPAAYNMAYLDTYEPGSVNKIFTVSAALEAGLVRPDMEFYVPEQYEYADKVFLEPFSKGRGELTVEQVVARSSNIGTIMIAEMVGPERMRDHLWDLGFGRFTGMDGSATVPDESAGLIPDTFFGTELATIAFGQGVALTPMQVAAAYNTVANGGVYLAPTLVRGVVDEGELQTWPVAPGRRVMSDETAGQITEMLTLVVSEGTGRLASVEGFTVAGKTGTAQKPVLGGYSETDYMSTFVGFVPAQDPELTILVLLDTATPHLAGEVAAPLFAELADYALQTLRVAPTQAEPVPVDSTSTGTDEEG